MSWWKHCRPNSGGTSYEWEKVHNSQRWHRFNWVVYLERALVFRTKECGKILMVIVKLFKRLLSKSSRLRSVLRSLIKVTSKTQWLVPTNSILLMCISWKSTHSCTNGWHFPTLHLQTSMRLLDTSSLVLLLLLLAMNKFRSLKTQELISRMSL